MLKETTGAFDGAWTHDWQASTDYESDMLPSAPCRLASIHCFRSLTINTNFVSPEGGLVRGTSLYLECTHNIFIFPFGYTSFFSDKIVFDFKMVSDSENNLSTTLSFLLLYDLENHLTSITVWLVKIVDIVLIGVILSVEQTCKLLF